MSDKDESESRKTGQKPRAETESVLGGQIIHNSKGKESDSGSESANGSGGDS
jgi:ribosomal protein L27